ncbi:MAG: hypothetical protein KBS59_02015 [Clostridiales bacterium]|nr:hypothetical protein [Clostridiales bacterium]
MYKKQMTFQRIVCFVALAACAVVFIYSLGLLTDLYDSLYPTMMDPEDISQTWVTGSQIYYEMQDFNSALLKCGIVLIIISLFLFITNTHKRRKYYIGNYISSGVNVIAYIGVSVWALPQIAKYKNQYLTTVDFDALKSFSEMWKSRYTDSTFWFDASKFVFALLIISAVLIIANLIWKIIMMKEERRLIDAGKESV